MSPKRTRKANELPYIPLGPFQWRIPGIHYKLEYVEFFQGLILGATALSSIPYLTDNLGLPYELAWSCVIIEVFMYMLHGWLGDPVVPGWITPTLPFTLAYLNGFPKGPERIQAMIALQLLVAFVFIFMGITKLADKFVNGVPNSIKGGILIAAPITVLQGQLSDGSQLMTAPIATLSGTLLLAFLSFSPFCEKNREKYKILDIMAKYGNLFPYLIAMLAGVLLGELSKPVLELGTLIRIPDFSNIFHTVSIFAVGFPPISKFISAIPLALICYVLAFGDFVTSQTLVEEAQDSRSDEYIDFNSSRSNLISGLRNLLLAIFAPFPPLAGPLWIGMTVSVAMRYKEGKKAMKSLIGGMSSFRMATFISVGMNECVNTLMEKEHKSDRYGYSEDADQLAIRILEKLQECVNSFESKYCDCTEHHFPLHAQVGIDSDYDISPGARIAIGSELPLHQHLHHCAKVHHFFPSGVGDIFPFDETAKRNPDAILDLIKGGFKEGMQYFSTYSSDSDVIRITGYLVKKSDIAKLDNGIAVPQANAKWGYYEVKNSKIYERKVRSLNGDR